MTGGGAPEVVLVKADGDAAGDRTYLVTAGGGRRVAVHPVHDLPHLVVESCLGIGDGLWAELAAGQHAGAARLLAAVADDRLALAVAAVRGVERRWAALGAGGRLRLAWPLSDGQLAGLAGGR